MVVYTVYMSMTCVYVVIILVSIVNQHRVFLGGENDFSQCLNELFPNLKTRTLTAIQWRVIRRLVGKPRRCSRVFFAEERSLLEEKRKRVRDIQKKIHQGAVSCACDMVCNTCMLCIM